MLPFNKIYNMDCLEGLKQLDSDSIHCCVKTHHRHRLPKLNITIQLHSLKTRRLKNRKMFLLLYSAFAFMLKTVNM